MFLLSKNVEILYITLNVKLLFLPFYPTCKPSYPHKKPFKHDIFVGQPPKLWITSWIKWKTFVVIQVYITTFFIRFFQAIFSLCRVRVQQTNHLS